MKTVLIWLLLCLIWGTTWIFIKVGLEDLPPMAFAASRFILAVVILFAVLRLQKIPLPKTAKEWRLIALTGVTHNYDANEWESWLASAADPFARAGQKPLTTRPAGPTWFDQQIRAWRRGLKLGNPN